MAMNSNEWWKTDKERKRKKGRIKEEKKERRLKITRKPG